MLDLDAPLALPIRRTSPFDPPVCYADLRATAPVKRVTLQNGRSAWLVARYADVRVALKDPKLSSDPRRMGFPDPEDADHSPFLIEMDAPEHTTLRRMLAAEFSPSRLATLRGHIQSDADRLIDAMVKRGNTADLLADYALPIPSLTICHLLGVPHEDMSFFQTKAAEASALEGVDKARLYGELYGYFDDLVHTKQAEPGDGLIDRLVVERLRGGEIDHHGVVKLAFMLLMAGFESTATMIALGVATLFQYPDQLALFCADRELTERAVEEMLRYHSIGDSDALRVAVADTEIGGQRIAAGEGVVPLVWSANRDETAFAQADSFDIRRDSHGQLAFGYGIHQCIGLNLARLEMQIALRSLFDRLPGLRPALPMHKLPFRYDTEVFGLKALPVMW
jgi:cytochrome P450